MSVETQAPPRKLSIPYWAKELGVSERTLWKKIAAKELRSSRVGRRVLVLEADMTTYLRRSDEGSGGEGGAR